MRFRRLTQATLFFLFLGLIALNSASLAEWLPVDAFVGMDPLLLLGTMAALKAWVAGFGAAVVVLIATAFLGRFFCSHVCPLGTTQDLVRPVFRSRSYRNADLPPSWRHWKYLLLVGLLAASLYGFSAVHWGSPTALAARFFGQVVFPATDFVLAPVISVLRSILQQMDSPLAYAAQDVRHVGGLLALTLFFLTILLLTVRSPRFWCRCLCPTGALLALVGARPLVARSVSLDCTKCGRCVRQCPMGAIDPDEPEIASQLECIACRRCEDVCPERAVHFTTARGRRAFRPYLPSRRGVLLAAGSGVFLAFTARRSTAEYWPLSERGHIMPPALIRPPGAVPETIFLNQCVRCGLCMKVCPTNMLQPAWLEDGISGIFSPLAVARRGPCDPGCNACGQVCPTRAIPPLSLKEKQWAKMGTAVIDRQKCLAWEFERACLVCDESCPYDAIRLERMEGIEPAVPHVDELKCAGCGYCEHHCPVQAVPAIRVTPMAALRLHKGEGNYVSRGKEMGLDISREKKRVGPKTPETDSPRQGEPDRLPPGFSS